MKFAFAILLLSTLAGCSSEIDLSENNRIVGQYQVVSMAANVEVDLNNDGERSIDFYAEISKPFRGDDGGIAPYYKFDFPMNFLKLSDKKMASINFPDQYVDQLSDNSYFLSTYLNSFLLYMYEVKGNEVKLTYEGNPNYAEPGVLQKLTDEGGGTLKLKLTKKVFDFTDSTWKDVEIETLYQKVD